jgi:hypothetical protein
VGWTRAGPSRSRGNSSLCTGDGARAGHLRVGFDVAARLSASEWGKARE